MNGEKSNFRSDTVAVSHVIGVVLMVAIFVTMLTLFQASMVPLWNKQVEAGHIPAVYDDMTGLSSDIADSASRAIAKTSNIQLGARYPDRMIFRNPGPGAFGTLTVDDDVNLNVSYNAGAPQNYKTSRITYELIGTVNSPKLVYEHGIIIREWDDGTVLGPVPPENHTLFDDFSANIYIPIVHGSSISASSLDSKSVSIFPFAESVTVTDIAVLNITLDTAYPEVWDDLLVNNSNITGYVSGDQIKIESTAIEKIYLPVVEDVISSDLYTGMITGTATLQGGLWISGEGTDIMAMGSRVANIPGSATASAIVIQDFVQDVASDKLNNDFVKITVADFDGNWWKVLINFQKPNSIIDIYISSANGVSKYKQTNFLFDSSTIVDLFNSLNFDTTSENGGLYQDAGVGSNNRLVTLVGDSQNMIDTAMISFRLMVDGD